MDGAARLPPSATTLRKMTEKPERMAEEKLEPMEAISESSLGRHRSRSRGEHFCSLTTSHDATRTALQQAYAINAGWPKAAGMSATAMEYAIFPVGLEGPSAASRTRRARLREPAG